MLTTRGQSGTAYETTTIFHVDKHLRIMAQELKTRLARHDITAVQWAYAEIDILLDARLRVMPGKHRYVEATENGIPL